PTPLQTRERGGRRPWPWRPDRGGWPSGQTEEDRTAHAVRNVAFWRRLRGAAEGSQEHQSTPPVIHRAPKGLKEGRLFCPALGDFGAPRVDTGSHPGNRLA